MNILGMPFDFNIRLIKRMHLQCNTNFEMCTNDCPKYLNIKNNKPKKQSKNNDVLGTLVLRP